MLTIRRSALLLWALLSAAVRTQAVPQEPFGHSRHGSAFDGGPRQAAYLMPGMGGAVHFPIAGLDDLSQRLFDQGITQLHGFWYFEAERSFRQVAMRCPEQAMAYWGMAMANVEHPERAAGFAAHAVRRVAGATPRERAWIDALARHYQIDEGQRGELCSGDAERAARATAAVVASNKSRAAELKRHLDEQLIADLGTIVFEHPRDIEAKALLAVQIWRAYDWGNGIPIVSHAAVDALLDPVFARAPDHPAHHYRIHLWDRQDARRALASAAVIGESAPGIAHQWHMASHVYADLHRHGEAAWQQEASSRVDHAYMRRDRVMPFLIHNYGHNQEWLARSLSHQGRIAAALAVARNLAEVPRHPRHNRVGAPADIAGYARRRLVQICVDHGLWQQAAELAASVYLDAGDDVGAEVQRLALLGRASFRLGRSDAARAAVTAAEALLDRARQRRAAAIDSAEQRAHAERAGREAIREAGDQAGRGPADDVQAVLDLRRELRGEELLAAGDARAALAEFEALRDLPLLLLQDARLAAGDVDAAVAALEQEHARHPGRAAVMAALRRAYLAKGESATEQLLQIDAELARAAAPSFLAHIGIAPDGAAAGQHTDDTDDFAADFAADFGTRPPLASLGPAEWSPFANPGFDLPAAGGGRITLPSGGDGRPRLVVFYLGFRCLHCVEQLRALRPRLAALAALGIEVVAIGTDDVAAMVEALADMAPEEQPQFPLLADPELAAFRVWRCHDDFEGLPLHGTFLVDGAGRVRWQDIAHEPFLELDWLVGEAKRLLALAGGAPPR